MKDMDLECTLGIDSFLPFHFFHVAYIPTLRHFSFSFFFSLIHGSKIAFYTVLL